MRTYNCPSCVHQFSEDSRDWDSAIDSGQCPACLMPLRNFHLHAQAPSPALFDRSGDSLPSAKEPFAVIAEAEDLHLPSENQPNASLVGAKGWLFFLILQLVFLGPLLFYFAIFMAISEAEGQSPQLTASLTWTWYKALLWFTYLIFAAVSIWGGYGLAGGREWSSVTRAKVVLWVVGPFGILIIGLLPYVVFGNLIDRVDPDLIPNLIGHVIVASAWTVYLSTSKRVRATYATTASA